MDQVASEDWKSHLGRAVRERPGTIKTVGISTDGLRDYVTLPSGLKVMVGQVGMSRLVSECARNGADARRALDEYLKTGEAVLPLDLDRLAELTAPPKVRWTLASGRDADPLLPTISLIPPQDRASTTVLGRSGVMANDTAQADKAIQQSIANQVYRIEQQIALISSHAGEASAGSIGQKSQKDDVACLRDLVSWLRRGSPYGNQSKNDTYYGLPEQTPGGVKAASEGSSLASLTENGLLADATLSKVEATANKVDLLVKAGKKFDHVKAKGDLFKVASSVQQILKDADLAAPWVKGELTKFAEEAKRLHGLFAPAKV